MSNISLALVPKNDFKVAASPPAPKDPPTPFSLRLTPSEKAYLTQKAGSRPLSTYIREELLEKQANSRRKERKPKVDEKQVAALLAELGQSRIPSNLNKLAKAANMGTLGTSKEIEQQLQDACAAVLAKHLRKSTKYASRKKRKTANSAIAQVFPVCGIA